MRTKNAARVDAGLYIFMALLSAVILGWPLAILPCGLCWLGAARAFRDIKMNGGRYANDNRRTIIRLGDRWVRPYD